MAEPEGRRIYFCIYKGPQVSESRFCSGCELQDGNNWEIPWSVRSVVTRGLGIAKFRWERREDGGLNMTRASCNRYSLDGNTCEVGGGKCRVEMRLKHETWFRRGEGKVSKLKLPSIIGGEINW
ncbi:MAG: hypothetical protein WCT01_04265 [Candidatus Shapirobacteria bacterium]